MTITMSRELEPWVLQLSVGLGLVGISTNLFSFLRALKVSILFQFLDWTVKKIDGLGMFEKVLAVSLFQKYNKSLPKMKFICIVS